MSRNRILVAAVVVLTALAAWVWLGSDAGSPTGGDPKVDRAASAGAGDGSGDAHSLTALRRRAQQVDAGVIPAADPTGQGAVLAKFGWGAGQNELGRNRPQEGNPEAPMSLALGPRGDTWVLDQVNNRLVKLGKDGKVEATLPLTVQGAQDLAVGRDGTVAVMDRLLDKQVALFDANGKPLGALPLEGKGLAEGGEASGVFVDGDGVYVEREHGDLVRVGDTSGKPDPEREEVPGRPSRDGKGWLTAMITSSDDGRISVSAVDRPSKQHRFTRELRLGVEVFGLNLLDTDQAGIIYLGAMVTSVTAQGERTPGVVLVCLDPRDGTPLGRADLPPNDSPEETLRELAVLDQGGVVYLRRTEEGASMTRWDCR